LITLNPFRVPWLRCHPGKHRFWPYLHSQSHNAFCVHVFCCACCVFGHIHIMYNYGRLALRLVGHINRQRAANKCCLPTGFFLYKKDTAAVCDSCSRPPANTHTLYRAKKGNAGCRMYFVFLVWPLHSSWFLFFRLFFFCPRVLPCVLGSRNKHKNISLYLYLYIAFVCPSVSVGEI